MRKILFVFLLFVCPAAWAAPQITVSASAVTLLGTGQSISITVVLVDPNKTGMLKVSGTGLVPIMQASTVTPGTTATVGPIYGNDVILDAFGNASTLVITPGTTAPNYWQCDGSDTTAGTILAQSGVSATTCTLKATVTSADVLTFKAVAF
jgi:hypothetical protein